MKPSGMGKQYKQTWHEPKKRPEYDVDIFILDEASALVCKPHCSLTAAVKQQKETI